MHRHRVEPWKAVVALLALVLVPPAFGVSCTTQSQMTAAARKPLEQAALGLAAQVQQGKTEAVRQQTIAPVAASFAGIAASIESVAPDIAQARLTVDNMYLLNASDLKGPAEAQFFCGLNNSDLTVAITIPNLPQGRYALAVIHATGVKQPQQLTLVLQNENAGQPSAAPAWRLAGFFTRPMVLGGQSGVWFWQQARVYAQKKEGWNAWLYYQAARYLLAPVDFLTSPNLQKLNHEMDKVHPADAPGTQPMTVTGGGQTYTIRDLHAGDFAGQLDLVLTYDATGPDDPVAERAQVIAISSALLQTHPELRNAFHGVWVHAARPNNPGAFALELPMDQIQTTQTSLQKRSQQQ